MHSAPLTESAVTDATLLAARDAVVACDLEPLRVLAVSGPDAASFLNGQLSVEVVGLASGACRYASFSSPKGRMLANFVVWREPPRNERFLILLSADIATSVAKRLSMYILRSKATIADVSAEIARIGIGGPNATRTVENAFGTAPAAFELQSFDSLTVLGLPGPRYVVVSAHATFETAGAALRRDATPASFNVWQWLTIRAGVPVITAATQDLFIAQTANWDILRGIDFQKGCYTGQEIIARTHYLGRLKERTHLFHAAVHSVHPGERLYSVAFGDQPCGTVVNGAAAPGGGCDLLAVLQLAAVEGGDARIGAPDGPALMPLPLPYAIPAATVPRVRPR